MHIIILCVTILIATQDLFCRAVPGIFGTQQAQYLDVIKQMLQQCFTDQNNPQVSCRFDVLVR